MEACSKFCDECPPLPFMIQAALGVKPVARRQGGDAADLLATLQVFPGAAPKPPEPR